MLQHSGKKIRWAALSLLSYLLGAACDCVFENHLNSNDFQKKSLIFMENLKIIFFADSTRCYNTSEFVDEICPTTNGFSGKCCAPPVGDELEQCIDCATGLCGTGEQITTCSLFGDVATYQCCVDLTEAPHIAPAEFQFG